MKIPAIKENNALSSTEQAVGVDVDGKVIYEKTCYADNVNWSSDQYISSYPKPSDISRLISIEGATKLSEGDWIVAPYLVTIGSNIYQSAFAISSDGVRLSIQNLTVTAYHAIVRYTKN